mmetsp:Transcript_74036/g.176239  ORF Transcript_74036/g.176239 Transcript_74036/m.176239 type:complete len:312 (-) Transcript_74036:17-952(-)
MGGVVFAAPCPSYHPLEYEGELLWVPRKLGQATEFGIPCLLLQQPRATRLLLYFHANAEDLGSAYWRLAKLRSLLGLHVLAMEYPGYGLSSGEANEDNLLADADTVVHFVQKSFQVPLEKVIALGRSVGGGPAIYLASKYKLGGLVTLSTFSSIQSVVGSYAGWGGWFPVIFDNRKRIRRVSCRTLIIHGSEDETVQVSQAHELASECGRDVGVDRGRQVVLLIRSGMGHNNFHMMRDVSAPIIDSFPELYKGDSLQLQVNEEQLKQGPCWVAPDVAVRVPYSRDCVPAGTHVRRANGQPVFTRKTMDIEM